MGQHFRVNLEVDVSWFAFHTYPYNIYNLYRSITLFPKAFKKALVHVLRNSDDNDVIKNYRPISVLPAKSKILEKVLNNRLIKFLESKHFLLVSSSPLYRANPPMTQFLPQIRILLTTLTKIQGLYIFLDVSVAFDTVWIVLKKNAYYVSDYDQLSIIVLQGSIFGPTLFIAYITS